MKITEHLSLDSAYIEPLGASFIQQKLKQVQNDIQASHHPICPYISSTFVDLEEEFKFLHSDTFLKLSDLCQAHGCHFSPMDVRRTAVDFRSSSDYTFKNALDNVKKCLPFFICIMGNQYGPHLPPSSKLHLASEQHHVNSVKGSTSVERNLLFAGSHGHPWVLDADTQTCSIMELEILASCFSKDSYFPKYCFFYFKDYYHGLCNHSNIATETEFGTVLEAETEYAQEKLNNLKRRIVNKGLSVKYFTSKEELGAAILQDWKEVLERLYPIPSRDFVAVDEQLVRKWCNDSYTHPYRQKFCTYSGLQKIQNCLNAHVQSIIHHSLSTQTNDTDCPSDLNHGGDVLLTGHKLGDGVFSSATSFIQSIKPTSLSLGSDKVKIFALVGDPGSGKTSLLVNWLHSFKTAYPDVLVISEFIGSSHASYDATSICRSCIRILREKSWNRKVANTEVQSYVSLKETFAACLQCHPCVILIDSLNDLKYGMNEDIGKLKGLEWLPKVIPSNCRLVVSTRRSDLTFKALKERDDVHIQWMPPIDLSNRERIFQILYREDARDILGRDLLDKVWTNRLSERPLFLSTLSDLLRSCRNVRDINQVVDKCTALRTFRDFWKSVFLLWSRRHSWNKQSSGQPGSIRLRSGAAGWVSDSLKMIASSRGGLLPREILHLLSLTGYRGRATVTPHDWNMFQRTAGCILRVGNDGLVTIGHGDAKLAINYLFLGGANVSTSSSGTVSVEQRYHLLLGSYFLKYGSMERKLVELPWHLDQGRDFSTLCQVLTKPRFFLAMCKESQCRPNLLVDHLMYWKTLFAQDFDSTQCFKMMINQATEEPPPILGPRESRRASAATQLYDGRRTLSLKAPSLIIITQHEDAPSLYRGTEESRSETEDRDFSEAESFSFFITEPETEHQLAVGGWSASEGDHEKPIDSSLLDEDELSELRFYIAWFLYQHGGEYRERGEENAADLHQILEQSRPLSSSQQLTLFRLIHLETDNFGAQNWNADLLRKALETFDQLSIRTMGLSLRAKRNLQHAKGEISLRLAKILVVDCDYEHAHQLIVDSFKIMQKCGSVCGQALAEVVFGALLHSQGMFEEAVNMTKRGLRTFTKWFGKMQLDVAFTLCDLAHIYATLPDEDDQNSRRKAMMALKQALEVFDFNDKKVEAAQTAERIGHLLTTEGSLRSKVEAEECFDRALDTYVTCGSDVNGKVRQIQSSWKETANDLLYGRYTHGSAKPKDTRSPERPFSSLSWHHRELDKLSVCGSSVAVTPLTDRSTAGQARRTARRSISPESGRPYSPYSTCSIGNYVLVTPRSQATRRVKSAASIYSWRGRSVRTTSSPGSERKESEFMLTDGEHRHLPSEYSSRSLPEGVARGAVSDRPEVVEGKEVPVIIVPAGRNSRLSVKLDFEDWERASRHVTDDVDDHIYLGEPPARSEPNSAKRSPRSTSTVTPRQHRRNSLHKFHCNYRAGPNHLSLSVHGPHSSVSNILPAPPSPRPTVRSTGICHESAWYHVPGRYHRPGEVLPRKRSQRPSSHGSVSSHRHSPHSTRSLVTSRNDDDAAKSIPEQASARSLPSALKRQTTSQQSGRTIVELPIYEERDDTSDPEEYVSTVGVSCA